MKRGSLGLLPRTPQLSDESYLDFVQSFRQKVAFGKPGQAAPIASEHLKERFQGKSPDDLELSDVVSCINEIPYARLWQRIMRTHQEMFWRRTRRSFARHTDELLEDLEKSDQEGPGKLVFDPDFTPPDYTRREIHLQPGGYTDDPIGGIVHHYGTKVFYSGRNDQNELHEEIANSVVSPEDGVVKRVIDVGCSLGQATMGLKKKFPDAEVWGLDVSLPMVRYAHQMANKQGLDVNYIQALAEETTFPDNHFDLALIYILFHEVPFAKTRLILKEVYRIMRPGGTVNILEFPNANKGLTPWARFVIDFDSRNNCEPYSPDLVYNDLHGVIRDTGFEIGPAEKNTNPFLQTFTLTKPS